VAEASERTIIALLKAAGWQGRICRSRDTAARTGRSERLADLVISAGATAYLYGTGGSRYLNPAPFAAQGLEVQFFTSPARLATLPPEADAVSAYRTRMPEEYGYRVINLKGNRPDCYGNVTCSARPIPLGETAAAPAYRR
jgi:hypothetical protein